MTGLSRCVKYFWHFRDRVSFSPGGQSGTVTALTPAARRFSRSGKEGFILKNKLKRALAAVLVLGLLCGIAVPGAWASGTVQIDPAVQAEFDRLIEIGAGDILDQFLMSQPEDVRNALVAAEEAKWAAPTVPTTAADVPASGAIGADIQWNLDGNGTLTITGTGTIFPFTEGRPAPWDDRKEAIKAVEISDGITEIGNRAFLDCVNLETVALPDELLRIGDEAFRGCASLKGLQLPGSVESIGWAAFALCDHLTWIQMPGTVTYLGGFAFYGCEKLNTVAIPSFTTAIEAGTFRGCTSLVDVAIHENVTFIGSEAFYGCTSLRSVTIPEAVTEISEMAFYGCTALKFANVPVTLEKIGAQAFAGCRNMSDFAIPGSVREIGDGAFRDCASLGTVVIPEGVAEVGNYAFRGCAKLNAVILPDSLEKIGRYAFSYCTKLESVRIPASVTEIGAEAFSNSGIWSVTFLGDAPQITENAFLGVHATAGYPEGASGWNRKTAVPYGGELTWETFSGIQ